MHLSLGVWGLRKNVIRKVLRPQDDVFFMGCVGYRWLSCSSRNFCKSYMRSR